MQRYPFTHYAMPAILFCGYAVAQLTNHAVTNDDDIARASRKGASTATVELTRQMFRRVALPPELADGLGFTDRLVAAESSYLRGEHSAVKEQQIVKAVNNLTATLGAPAWTRTSAAEVRKLRVHMLVTMPHLVGYQGAADAAGKYRALPEVMSPIEAAYVTSHLLYQKAYNSEYQLTTDEQATLSDADAVALHAQRTQDLQSLLQGKTRLVSVRDLLAASDRLFNDLDVPPTTATGVVSLATHTQSLKGGR